MGEVVYLDTRRLSPVEADEGLFEIDLVTAVDVALRDLADITRHSTLEAARAQAEACRRMLKAAFDAAVYDD